MDMRRKNYYKSNQDFTIQNDEKSIRNAEKPCGET